MAVTLTFDQFRARLQLTEEQEADAVALEALQSWYDYGVTAVTKYAPMAPAAVSNLAVSMIGTYLLTQPSYTGAQRRSSPGWWDAWNDPTRAGNPLRFSGTGQILKHYRRWRALA